MIIIKNKNINEELYVETLENGLKVIIVPKKTRKKYIVWSANFGSIDNKFYADNENELTVMPDGIAHYLEHKLFEQKNGKNSLDVLTSMGVDANAYTTNDHTAYLYECTENFYDALNEFMNFIQFPYFTDENVNKERGIIEQEIMMYDDYPEWTLYMNAMKAMYHVNEINIDVAGTKETISHIDKEKLYKIYRSFYLPQNMVMVVVGDFEINELMKEIKRKMLMRDYKDLPKRVYNEEPESIVKDYVEEHMDISMPLVLMAYKDNKKTDMIKKDIAFSIIASILFGRSTNCFKELYESGKIFSEPGITYEFSKTYAHGMIQFSSNYPEDVINKFKDTINNAMKNGIDENDFIRAKKSIYGSLIKEYNEVSTIATNLVADYFREIIPYEYFDEFAAVTKEYVEEVLNDLFKENNLVVSVIKPN